MSKLCLQFSSILCNLNIKTKKGKLRQIKCNYRHQCHCENILEFWSECWNLGNSTQKSLCGLYHTCLKHTHTNKHRVKQQSLLGLTSIHWRQPKPTKSISLILTRTWEIMFCIRRTSPKVGAKMDTHTHTQTHTHRHRHTHTDTHTDTRS